MRLLPWRRIRVGFLLCVSAASVFYAVRHSGWDFPAWGQVTWLRPEALLAACLFQVGNGLSDVCLWRAVLVRAGLHPSWRALWRLSFSVQAINQLLPSAGISGSVAMVSGLEAEGASRPVAVTAVVITTVSFYFSLAGFLGVAVSPRDVPAVPLAILWAVALSAWLLRARVWGWVERRWGGMDASGVRSPQLWLWGLGCQALAWMCDLATLGALVTTFESDVSVATLMVALAAGSVAKSAVPLFQGLGVAEAAMAACFVQWGVAPVHAAATAILYRVVRFWLPLVPGAYLLVTAKDHSVGRRSSVRSEASVP